LNSAGRLEVIYRELLANRGLTGEIIFARCGGAVAARLKGRTSTAELIYALSRI
jgi:hypothetical protein